MTVTFLCKNRFEINNGPMFCQMILFRAAGIIRKSTDPSISSRKMIIDTACQMINYSIFVFIASFSYPMRSILSVLCILICIFIKINHTNHKSLDN